jgi:hypothetical protein
MKLVMPQSTAHNLIIILNQTLFLAKKAIKSTII